MEGKEGKTPRLILEMLSANKEEVEVSVEMLGYQCKNVTMYTFASEILRDYATKKEIEDFLSKQEWMMKGDAPEAYQDLKLEMFLKDDLGV
jgi:hypothetical protein